LECPISTRWAIWCVRTSWIGLFRHMKLAVTSQNSRLRIADARVHSGRSLGDTRDDAAGGRGRADPAVRDVSSRIAKSAIGRTTEAAMAARPK
jgi:hypothetical protein